MCKYYGFNKLVHTYTLLQVSCVIERTVTVGIHRGHSHVGVLMDVTQILGTV